MTALDLDSNDAGGDSPRRLLDVSIGNGHGRQRRSLLVLLATLVLVGCGGSSPAPQSLGEKAGMDLEFLLFEAAIAEEIYNGGHDGISDLPKLTDDYIRICREYKDELGREEIPRRLADMASQVDEWCSDCAKALDRERDRLR